MICGADFRHFDEDHVAEFVLGVVGDADGADVAFHVDPLVVFRVAIIAGYILTPFWSAIYAVEAACKMACGMMRAGGRLAANADFDFGVRPRMNSGGT